MKKKLKVLLSVGLAISSIALQLGNIPVIADENSTGKTVVSESEDMKIANNADIIFAIDSTGSMGSYIDSVKENLTNFVTSLNEKGVSLNMSVVEFRDIEEDGTDSTIYYNFDGSKWTSDVNKVIDVFDSIDVSGGGDDPETPIDAFEKIDDFPREDTNKFIFLLTDADYKDYEDTEENRNNNHYSMNAWTEAFRMNNVKVTVVSQLMYEDEYNYLYTMTGGRFIDINSSNYYELMKEYSEWIYKNTTDSDGDGLPDEWEINGVDTDHDGTIDLDLKAMGADPKVPDVFVEADWMEYEGDSFKFLWLDLKKNKKNTAPSKESLKKVYEQFKAHGINIHIDAGPDSIMNYETGEKWGKLSHASAISYEDIFVLGNNYENWNKMAINNFAKQRWTTFRYCLFVGKYDCGDGEIYSSGIAENIPGQFFIVASDCIGGSDRDTALAGTFMHELGHTLGLSHGGVYVQTSEDKVEVKNNHVNYKPNHLSIMNYTYQFSGVKNISGDCIANYQDFILPEIDEEHIDETRGIDPYGATEEKELTMRLLVGNKFLWAYDKGYINVSKQAIDFDGNGIEEENIKFNLNNDFDKYGEPVYGMMTETLNEWNNLKYIGGLIGGYGDEINVNEITTLITKSELTEELKELTIDEAYENGLLGEPGECKIEDIDSKTLYSEQKNQKTMFRVSNLYPEDTTVKVKMSSDVLTGLYETELNVTKEGVTVEIPVKDNLEVGCYDVSYSLTLANGEVVTQDGKINVVEPESITMKVGDTEIIPVDSIVSCESSDNSIVEIMDNKIVAKTSGTTYLKVTLDGNETYCAKVTVLEPETKPTQSPSTGDMSNVITWIVILFATSGAIMVSIKRKKGEIE